MLSEIYFLSSFFCWILPRFCRLLPSSFPSPSVLSDKAAGVRLRALCFRGSRQNASFSPENMTDGQKSAIKRSKFKQFPITKALSGTIFQKNVAKPARISKIAFVSSGEVSEWLKEHAWKACIRSKPYQGFKSLPHRHADFHFILFASFLSLFLFSVCSFQFIRLITAVLLNKVCLYIFHLRARDFLWLRNDSQHKSGCDSAVKKFRKHSAIFTYAWKRRRLEYGE